MTPRPSLDTSPTDPGAALGARVGTLLGVWAHPDDEAYLSAALMAVARRHGQRVVVITATAGERGTSDPERWPPSRLARLRQREMATSLRAIGVTEHRWLGYPDGGCSRVPGWVAVEAIGRIVDEVQPDTIVTFGPEGMTGHPDHIAVSDWTTEAWRHHAPDANLWYATQLSTFHDRWGELNDRVGLFADCSVVPSTPPGGAAAVVECDGWLLGPKRAALAAHASQVGALVDLVGLDVFQDWWTTEAFVDACAVAAQPATCERLEPGSSGSRAIG